VAELDGRSLDIECAIEPAEAGSVGLRFEGVEGVRYDVGSQTMRVLDREHEWPLEPDGTLRARVLFDVNCLEVFGPHGLKVMSSIYSPETLATVDETRPSLALAVEGGPVRVKQMRAYPVRSIWEYGLE
jgi:hypothetical protein